MKIEVIQNLEDFLNDFQYCKLEGYDAFYQSFGVGSKLIVVNITPYEDGLMLEIQLALKINKVEELICRFYGQENSQLKLTYWENINQIADSISKRTFIQNSLELSKNLSEIENALVKNGFSWLDTMSNLNVLSTYYKDLIFTKSQKHTNIFKLCQRSYLLRLILSEKMTEAIFYDYYEGLQAYKVPEQQLEEFIAFRKFLASITF